MIVIIMPMLASPGISARTLAMTPSCRDCHVFSWGGGDGVSLVGRCFLLFTQSPAAAYLLLQTWLSLTYTQLPPSSTQLPLSHSSSLSYLYPATSLSLSLVPPHNYLLPLLSYLPPCFSAHTACSSFACSALSSFPTSSSFSLILPDFD